jgi:hypothetical protein
MLCAAAAAISSNKKDNDQTARRVAPFISACDRKQQCLRATRFTIA